VDRIGRSVLVKLDFEFEGEIGRGDGLWKGKKVVLRDGDFGEPDL
jgi:hypothetical protein